ncbi:MAG TPA: aminotransferase class V-fold PLP-dependent enzyme, partial [Acidobacteriota bacterium]|nr:aminotransferase class V-fold PLP-dependent enzyme [Acidobacteriota bacterium]
MLKKSNPSQWTRRELLRLGGMAGTASLVGAPTVGMSQPVQAVSDAGPNVFTRVGVRPFISLTATITINGGSHSLPEVKQAIFEAATYKVNLFELMDKVGERLSELLGCEAAIVTSGAAAALTHATSACLAGGDPELIQQLPDLTGLKTEVVIPRQSRNTYDHAIRSLGVKIIEIDSPEEFYAALGPNTAMIGVLGTGESKGKIRLEEMAEMARKLGIPILVDAAAEIPSKPNVYLSRGADLVAYSGGKVLRGPQCAGLLIGRKDLVRAAWVNSAPHHSFGRAMKVGKEEIMGMLAAIEVLMSQGTEGVFAQWRSWLEEISRAVTAVDGVHTKMADPEGASPYPTMTVEWDPEKISLTAGEVNDLLMNGEPRIASHASGDGHSFRIRPAAMRPGDAEVAGRRLSEIFRNAPRGIQRSTPQKPVADLSGTWEVAVQFESGK